MPATGQQSRCNVVELFIDIYVLSGVHVVTDGMPGEDYIIVTWFVTEEFDIPDPKPNYRVDP